jgi:stage III sporulation protein AA
MLIVNQTPKTSGRMLFNYIPSSVRRFLYNIKVEELEELRLRLNLPVSLYFSDGCYFLSPKGQLTTDARAAVRTTQKDMDEAMELITESSVYAVEHEIKHGYVTLRGGHRVGISGSGVLREGEVSFIKNITSLNYRFAREVLGAAERVVPYLYQNGRIKNTLILSPPQCGKTTMLRDMIRILSGYGKKISVVDERSEIAGMCGGTASYDLGVFTDVLDGCPKAEGMLLMLRSMSPDVIVTDEIGTDGDIDAIRKIQNCGVNLITSIHARDRSEVMHKQGLYDMFDCFVTLSRKEGAGTVEEVYTKP